MIEAIQIEPEAVYDDGSLRVLLGLSDSAIASARRSGALRFSRQGKRVLYLGKWVLAWLERDADAEARTDAN